MEFGTPFAEHFNVRLVSSALRETTIFVSFVKKKPPSPSAIEQNSKSMKYAGSADTGAKRIIERPKTGTIKTPKSLEIPVFWLFARADIVSPIMMNRVSVPDVFSVGSSMKPVATAPNALPAIDAATRQPTVLPGLDPLPYARLPSRGREYPAMYYLVHDPCAAAQ